MRGPPGSVVVPRYADGLREVLILDGRFQRGAGIELTDDGALHLLPRCLARWNGIATASLQLAPPRLQLRLAHEHVGFAATQVDTHPIIGTQQGEPTSGGGLR